MNDQAGAEVKVERRKPPIDYIVRTREQYSGLGYPPYAWTHSEDDPSWTEVPGPLSELRLGVIATGGIYRTGQTAFTYRDDTTYRAIPTDVEASELRATHFAYDLTDARDDINVVFPIDTLRSLVAEGRVGELGPRFYTCMGGIYSQRRVGEELAPALVQRCLEDELDVVLLVPV